ncbi:pectin lyase F, putative, partial [Rhizoctonia solani AG-3 Rhs1AP]
MFVLGSLAAVLFAKGALAVGSPFGYATGTTGGAGAAQAIPTSAAQLKSWLEDSVTRNILLDRTYDFTDTEGSVTETGCKPWTCSPNPQLAINANNWCSADAAKVSVTYKKAPTSGIMVRSNKTILGKGSSGWIKGKGLRLVGSTNVIIQNIRISDLNAQYVWGGDAIGLEGASKIWIDHNYIQSIGRQFIVSHFDPNTQITISNNYFNGQTTYSTGCDQHHYWTFMFVGKADQITFARNYIYRTAGRGPKVGGTSGYTQNLHIYNNYWNDVTGHALDAGTGSRVLMEGNVFNAVRTPSTGDSAGTVFAPTSSSMNAQCSSVISRNCVSNTLTGGSGTLANSAKTAAISPFTASTVKSASVMDPSSVASYVLANAGLGKVN